MTHRWKYKHNYTSPREKNPARCTRDGCGVAYYLEPRPPKVKTYYNSPVEVEVFVLADGAKVATRPACGAKEVRCPTCKGRGVV